MYSLSFTLLLQYRTRPPEEGPRFKVCQCEDTNVRLSAAAPPFHLCLKSPPHCFWSIFLSLRVNVFMLPLSVISCRNLLRHSDRAEPFVLSVCVRWCVCTRWRASRTEVGPLASISMVGRAQGSDISCLHCFFVLWEGCEFVCVCVTACACVLSWEEMKHCCAQSIPDITF